QLAGRRVQREQAARLHLEDLARLVQDQADRLAHVEALVDRVARAQQGLGLPGAALGLLEEARVLDRDAGLIREALEHRLLAVPERARLGRERGDDADDLAADPERHAQQRADALLLVQVPPRRARIHAEVLGAHRPTRRDREADE